MTFSLLNLLIFFSSSFFYVQIKKKQIEWLLIALEVDIDPLPLPAVKDNVTHTEKEVAVEIDIDPLPIVLHTIIVLLVMTIDLIQPRLLHVVITIM